eukprot:c19119_g1_i1.p1 GENE.c19119_g1_i1~~c19119_g1_i1.p1  ORF type:complete len:100 (-),score=14.03 c19119_g1_i1:28-327(-)
MARERETSKEISFLNHKCAPRNKKILIHHWLWTCAMDKKRAPEEKISRKTSSCVVCLNGCAVFEPNAENKDFVCFLFCCFWFPPLFAEEKKSKLNLFVL